MKRTDLPERFQTLLAQSNYVTIATASLDGRPWNSPVVGRFDDDLNLYWCSWKQNQHSQNVAANPRVFVVVYDSHVPDGQGEGLYLQMRAIALDTSEVVEAAGKVYDTSFFAEPVEHAQFLGDCPQRLYKAVPEKIWYNVDGEEQGHFVDTRAELMRAE